MNHGQAFFTGRASPRCRAHDPMGPSSQTGSTTDMVKVTLSGKQHPTRFSRGNESQKMRPFVKAPQQCFNCQKFDLKVFQLRRGSRNQQPCLPQNGSSNQEIKDSTSSVPDKVINRTNHECVVQEMYSHHGGLPKIFSGGRSSSSPTTETPRRSDEITGHPKDTCYHQGENTRFNTQTNTGKGMTTQTTGRKSAMWSRTKKSSVDTTTTTGGRNRSYHYCHGRGNSLVEENINRGKTPHSGTKENDRSSSRRDRYTHRIDSVCCSKKVLLRTILVVQEHHVQTGNTVISPTGPSQDHDCSHTVSSINSPFH